MAAMPFKVKALFDYASEHDDDLKFSIGQVITVTEEEDDDWYCGEYVDDAGTKQEGLFPRNFVEKYEPTAPPRPTRTRTKKESDPVAPVAEPPAPVEPPEETTPKLGAESDDEDEPPVAEAPLSPVQPSAPAALSPTQAKPTERAPKPAPAPAPAASKPSEPAPVKSPQLSKPSPAPRSGSPPAVSEKPSSFKDRLARFNQAAAPPIAPFKPSGLAGDYVKKPFVAPPPSRNAYVPPPQRDVPIAKVYRRDEDPEIREREAENLENAEKAGLVPGGSPEAEDEDQPKPLSLKERMALLQRQQQEQAQRHADIVAKKEKPKRPPKKRLESQDAPEGSADAEATPVPERRGTDESSGKKSMDSARSPPPPPRASISRGIAPSDSFNDGNEADMSGAGDTTEGQEETEHDDSDARPKPPIRAPSGPPAARQDEEEAEGEEEDEEEEEDDDVDPEVRRKEELRARMAKMSGGMGFHGMFGGPGMMPMAGGLPAKKKKAPPPPSKDSAEQEDETASSNRAAPPVPTMMALPGMSSSRPVPKPAERAVPEQKSRAPPPPPRPAEDEDEEDEEDEEQETPGPSVPPRGLAGPPPIPGGRPVPPPVLAESRPPPLPPAAIKSDSAGSESDDELSERALAASQATPKGEAPPALRSPPPLPPSMPSPGLGNAARMPPPPPTAYPGSDEMSPTSPTSASAKRASRPPPPVPGVAPAIPGQSRAPPPPPPGASLSRQSTADTRIITPTRPAAHDDEDEEEVTEYEGDYDTDIASSVPHKDALKSHARESSFEDNTTIGSPALDGPPSGPPPLPTGAAPRGGPPPVPSQPPPDRRRSVDQPKAAPPPPPPGKEPVNDGSDPYSYASPHTGLSASGFTQKTPKIEEEGGYFPDSSLSQVPSHERRGGAAGPSNRGLPSRHSLEPGKRSIDASRQSLESGFIANDIDLAKQSGWWKQANQVPPVLQGRRDVYYESEESTSTNRGAKTIITRTIFVLFQDYSQTILTVRFDPYDPSDVELEQRHEPAPRPPRPDQLEQSYDRFGSQISQAVAGKKDSVVADGSPQGLVHDLLRPFRDALAPVGTRAYGALVYANMANASTQQNDEIRPGDIMSIRNAKFQGKHGAMHAKYSMDVGKPDHVAVVAEWDGTKKKVRAWEQGRESKKVRLESYKLDDLRGGEVKIWRVMPRSWLGWNMKL